MNQQYSELDKYLSLNKYQKLINILEEKIELEPENFTYYCYLGLAHFLCEEEEEARLAWLFVFNQEEDQYLQKLVALLEKEAQQQCRKGNHKLAYSLREIIQEICPDAINNLFIMVELAIKLNIFNQEYLQELRLVEAINQNNYLGIKQDYLLEVLGKILTFPFASNVDLIKTILPTQSQKQDIIDLILKTANHLRCSQTNYFSYIANLFSICIPYITDRDNLLSILHNACECYLWAGNYEQAQILAQEFQNNALTTPQQAFAYYRIVQLMMYQCEWLENQDNISKYQQKLDDLVSQNNENIETYILNSLIEMSSYRLYIDDNPHENRKIFNYCSSLFHKLQNQYYSSSISNDHYSEPKQKKKLKIGYVASTFNHHCVGSLSRWLINYHDHKKFDIYIYLIGSREDQFTNIWFKTQATKFVSLSDDTDKIITEIKKDQVDILIELDSFTYKTTQEVMALKPAPIQVSWLGLDSMGMPTIDYFIVDSYVLPHSAEKYYQETLWRLPNTYLAVDGFEIGIPSIKRLDLGIPDDSVVYLSLQTPFKRNPENIRLQMKILKQVPDSYFMISGGPYASTIRNVKNLFDTIAQEEDVNPNRIMVLPFVASDIYRANLALGDIVLDTYPFNGATTNLDALWMNIPLVTRVGEQFHARQGYTFLSHLGITEGMAWTDEEYIDWGIQFGLNEELRNKVSWQLQKSKNNSPLWNGKEFTKDMENAYQKMWEIYISK